MRRFLPVVVIFAGVYLWQQFLGPDSSGSYGSGASSGASPGAAVSLPARQDGAGLSAAAESDAVIARAFSGRRNGLQVEGAGTVTRVLADDNDGSRHQRFILELGSGQTLLVAHNIDLAPRVAGIGAGDRVRFYGEYEWNDQGGVIHWTHADPAGRHVTGWLEHRGRRYQ